VGGDDAPALPWDVHERLRLAVGPGLAGDDDLGFTHDGGEIGEVGAYATAAPRAYASYRFEGTILGVRRGVQVSEAPIIRRARAEDKREPGR
jgi:hypothetical protein